MAKQNLLWLGKMVKNVNAELEIKHIKKISEDHQFEDDA